LKSSYDKSFDQLSTYCFDTTVTVIFFNASNLPIAIRSVAGNVIVDVMIPDDTVVSTVALDVYFDISSSAAAFTSPVVENLPTE
tara:strand:- start:8542 stop:8793 length:252 start_codon:yes stop_codon:yes gene_type:complete